MVTPLYYDDRPWDSRGASHKQTITAKTRVFDSPLRCQLNFPDSNWDFGQAINPLARRLYLTLVELLGVTHRLDDGVSFTRAKVTNYFDTANFICVF